MSERFQSRRSPETNVINLKFDPTNVGKVLACLGIFEIVARFEREAQAKFDDDTFSISHGSLDTVVDALDDFTGGVGQSDPITFPKLGMTIDWYVEPLILAREPSVKKPRSFSEVENPIRYRQAWLRKFWGGNQTPAATMNVLLPALRGVPRDVGFLQSRISNTKAKFGFDLDATWNALELGFSPNRQGLNTLVSPAVEVFGYIGLQTFRPASARKYFDFNLWSRFLPIEIARAAFCTDIPGITDRPMTFIQYKRGQSYLCFSKATPRH